MENFHGVSKLRTIPPLQCVLAIFPVFPEESLYLKIDENFDSHAKHREYTCDILIVEIADYFQ